MGDPKLIEDVAVAIHDHRSPMEPGVWWRIGTEEDREWYRGLATAAVSVMERALAEREGEIERLREAIDWFGDSDPIGRDQILARTALEQPPCPSA